MNHGKHQTTSKEQLARIRNRNPRNFGYYLRNHNLIVMEYRGYTVFEESVYPKGTRWMCYPTASGEDNDCDYVDGDRVYRGNCKWADTIEEAIELIDELLTEAI